MGEPNNQNQETQAQGSQQEQTSPQIDYGRIQTMLDGTLAAKEKTALQAYFKQQGLSQEDAEKAMADFKAQQKASQPDVAGLQTQLQAAQQAMMQATIQNAAMTEALKLGVDVATMPYLIKMADMSKAVKDGKVNNEAIQQALSKVLEDIPALKPQATGGAGFKFGATGQQGTENNSQNDALDRIFGVKKK